MRLPRGYKIETASVCSPTMTRIESSSVSRRRLIIHRAESGELVAVACPTGHAIAKSLRRMIRRLARKARPKIARAVEVDGGSCPHDPPQVAGRDDCEGP